MAQNTSVTVSAEIMSEVLGNPLEGLDSKIVLLSKINQSSIAGKPTKVRKIPKRQQIAVAVDDGEGVAVGPGASLGYDSTISLTPTTKRQNLNMTLDALMLAMPGASREQVIQAVQSGNPATIGFIRDAALKLMSSHMRRAETDSLALLAGASESDGQTNTALAFSHLLGALFKLLDNNPESEDLAFILEEKGVADLRSVLAAGTGAALSTIWGNNGTDTSLFRHQPDTSRSGLRGSVLDIPVFAADKNLMTTANAGVDRVGGLIVVGRGETGAPGSVRGFAEFCEFYAPSLGYEFNLLSDDVDAVARWKWDVAEHTDQHVVKIIYKKD